MISALLPLLLSVVTAPAPQPAVAAANDEPAIRVTVNHATYDRGDRARVYVRVRDDGYVVVLHTDADGRVRVLFPVDPGDDNFMRGGQKYEIRARGNRDAFQVTRSGSGTVYAAVSVDPYRFDAFVRGDHWDFGTLDDSSAYNDPEAAMTNIAEQMAGGAHFAYDVTTYTVDASYATASQVYIAPSSYSCWYNTWDPWCDRYYPSPSFLALNIGFGFGFGRFRGYPYGYYPYGYPYYPRYGGYYGSGYYNGFYPRYPYYGHRNYGANGYGYTVGRGWHRNTPVTLGPGGGYYGSRYGTQSGIGLGAAAGGTIGYRNRGTLVSNAGSVSLLHESSRFSSKPQHDVLGGVHRSAGAQGDAQFGRRTATTSSGVTVFRGRGNNEPIARRPSDATGMRPATRDGARDATRDGATDRGVLRPATRSGAADRGEVLRPATRGDAVDRGVLRGQPPADVGADSRRPERVQPQSQPRVDSRPERVQPQSQPRSEARPERAQPQSQPRSEARPERAPPRSEARPERSEPRSQSRPEARSRAPSSDRGSAQRGGGGRGGDGGGRRRP
jgi:hypothetical protein